MKLSKGFFDQLIDSRLQKQVHGANDRRLVEQDLESDHDTEERKQRLIQAIGEKLDEALQQPSIKTVDDELSLLENWLSKLDAPPLKTIRELIIQMSSSQLAHIWRIEISERTAP